ncbi:MAG: thioredoxin domain-containing protein [Saprospiraceae bacterium]
MKKGLLLFIFAALQFASSAQGIEFFHGTWQEALDKAKAENKAIFVDAYTTWCGPCKRMSSQVFILPDVGKFYNENFINVKMDMEKGEGPQFGSKYPVRSYPTFLFINPDGAVAHQAVGGRGGEEFIALGDEALKKTDTSLDFAKKYDAGDHSPELVYNYVKALNKAGKPSAKIVNDYLAKNKDFSDPNTQKILYEGAVESDSKAFELLLKNKNKVSDLMGKEAVDKKILTACIKTAQKSLEFDAPELAEDAKKIVKKELPAESAVFNWKCDMAAAMQKKSAADFMSAAVPYAKKALADKPADLYALSKKVQEQFGREQIVWKDAGVWAAQAASAEPKASYVYLDAWYTWKNGNAKKAKAKAEQAIELAKGDKRENPLLYQQLLEDIGN